MRNVTIDFTLKRGKWDKIIFTDEQKEYIISQYTENRNISTVTLAEEFGISYPIIVRLLVEEGIPRKTQSEIMQVYDIDENFFDVIDNEEKAYWLGFLYADGAIIENENTVRLGLASVDENHLIKYKDSLNSGHPIKTSTKRTKDKNYYTSIVGIGNKHLVEQLVKKGCFQNKSTTLKFPSRDIVPKELINHFIRGYFDGDGSLYYTKRKTKHSNRRLYRVSIIGTESFMEEVKLILNSKVKLYKPKNKNMYELKLSGNQQCSKIYEYLYKNSTVYLDRKYKLFQEMLQYIKDNTYTVWNKGLTKEDY